MEGQKMSIFFKKNKNIKQPTVPINYNQERPLDNEGKEEAKFQNRALWLLLFVGIISLTVFIWRFSSLLKVPPAAVSNVNSQFLSLLENTNASAQLEGLKDQDTDQDGLTDFEELYVYKTSPYIADSDSDDLNDKLEIEQGSDPNCPKGTDCGRTTNGNTNTNSAGTNTNTTATTTVDPNNMTADQLRELLRNAGASDTDLQQIDDATLMATYRQALPEVSAETNINSTGAGTDNTNTSSTANTNQNTQAVTYEQLKNLSPADIRQLLIDSGVDKATLDGVDDTTLQSVFLEALDQEISGASQ
jgi:hypothetical protein